MRKVICIWLVGLLCVALVGCSSPASVSKEEVDAGAIYSDGYDVGYADGYADGLEAGRDDSSDQVIPAPESTPQPTIEVISDIGTRKNPVPLGQVLTGALSRGGDPLCEFEMSIFDVIRGEEAWGIIKDANKFNDEPTDEQEYVLAKVRIKNTADLTGVDEPLEVSKYDFDLATSNDSISNNQPTIVLPNPQLDLTLYEGSEDVGYIAFLVSKSENSIKAVFADSFWLLLQ